MERNVLVQGRTDTTTPLLLLLLNCGRLYCYWDEETVQHLLDLLVVVLLNARWCLPQFRGEVKETRTMVTEAAQLTRGDARMWAQNTLNGRRL